ncbi:pilin [uncultured Pseudoteredinibacter sp.]|uniref:pilin n=1 Tax=uncultured Pseudoteredinibacter sp. TaxID=1641701 RepID=UPI002603219D|nr:pilin [uncultured Pseudoteredinibacter sp.]
MKTVQKGFTLIELMIVVAIIGILAAVALPAYQDYTSRTKVTEPVSLLSGLKIDVSAYHTDTGTLPTLAQLTAYAGPKVTSGKFTTTVTGAAAGIFIATMRAQVGANINNATVQMSFSTDANGLLVHVCKPGAANAIPNKYLPAECRP